VKEEKAWLMGTVEVEVKFHRSKEGEWGWKAVVVSANLVAVAAGIGPVPGVLCLRRTWSRMLASFRGMGVIIASENWACGPAKL
jgi:hypothetical protein